MKIPITVFTGFLGAGKTTIILHILKQLSAHPSTTKYKVVLIKNEYGSSEVDSQLANVSGAIAGVKEVINGCLCCILVGQLQNAIDSVVKEYSPDRIIIETSGSALPGPLAWQLNEMEHKLAMNIRLDAIITVIDCLNFRGYEDTSYTAKLQAKYTDLILMNKWELVDNERDYDIVLDHVYTLNPDTPKVKVPPIDLNLIFSQITTKFGNPGDCGGDDEHMHREVDVCKFKISIVNGGRLERKDVESLLESERLKQSLEYFYRIKGFARLHKDEYIIINWAFGRFELTETPTLVSGGGAGVDTSNTLLITTIGKEPNKMKLRLESALNDELKGHQWKIDRI